jgi:hypothetical protein
MQEEAPAQTLAFLQYVDVSVIRSLPWEITDYNPQFADGSYFHNISGFDISSI